MACYILITCLLDNPFIVRRTWIWITCSPGLLCIPVHVCILNRLNKLCWSMSQNATGSKWSKSHELKLITRLEDLLSLHFAILHVTCKYSKNGQAFLSKNSNFHKFDVGLTGVHGYNQTCLIHVDHVVQT